MAWLRSRSVVCPAFCYWWTAVVVVVITLLHLTSVVVSDEQVPGSGYVEVPCCTHHFRHQKDHVREFTCGHHFYRTFYMDEARDTLYVGAMDKVLRVNMNNVTQTNCESDTMTLEPTRVSSCLSRGKSEQYDCRNHIRVIQPMSNNRLYICGTNAHNPKDWVIYTNLTHLARREHVPGIGNGVARCPFDPSDNSTAVWVEHGNPGGLPGLYSGTVAEFTKADTVIFRADLFNYTTKRREYPFKRTIKYDSKWLDKPNFVGSYEVGEYVMFFFRETAVEYINCGKNVYSRVARVCKKDTGGKNILTQNWATYLKARLNCSIPGEFPFYFNEIQSVYKIPGDDSRFYAVFTTSMNGLMGSAICTFSLYDIQDAFLGRFKEQATSSSAWLPVLISKVPEPRPGQCVNDTQTLPDNVLTFLQSHPLMDEAVAHEHNKPVFFKRDLIFTHLVVDKVTGGTYGQENVYTVYYAGSLEGRVYKVVEWMDENEESHSELLDVYEVTTPEPIRAIQISKKHKSLYVSSDMRVRQVDLFMCHGRYDNCLRCSHDPYCGWDKDANMCKPYKPGLLQDVTGSTPGLCDACIAKKKMVVTWGQSIHLGCAVKLPRPISLKDITWHHYSKDKGKYQIRYRPDKYIETSEHGLVVMNVNEADAGRYDCKMGGDIVCSYNITVDAHRCSAPARTNDFQKVYSDWCHEFEKYKLAMKTWERKQAQCASRNNISHQNSHPNDIYARSNPFV
ncbi:semaphorin-2A-like isoform X1 [Portunus trituberculatus]|uniref:semaphorin-2A-like isoform X1 n=3 Tax=Portunus trituberculatus TaxID=210409 RepID=UPI001E1CF919|nr:semaphorin-2A-like isoform X1 [Portunus trituberculatus]